MQRPAGGDAGMVGGQLAAEVEPFLQVRAAGGQLAAQREVPAPGAPALAHGNGGLGLFRQREETAAGGLQRSQNAVADPVTADIEKAVGAAGGADLLGDRRALRPPAAEQWRHVDDGQAGAAHLGIIPLPARAGHGDGPHVQPALPEQHPTAPPVAARRPWRSRPAWR